MPDEKVDSKVIDRTKSKSKVATHADNEKSKQLTQEEPDEDALVRALNRELRHKAMQKFTAASDARRRYDWEWLTRDLYRRGYQFSRYNPSNRTVVLSSRSTIKVPINLMWAQMRVIKNQVTSFKPKWEVLPTGISQQSLANAQYSGKALDYYYEKLNLKKKIKETVIQGLQYSVGGPWQIGYDPEGDNGNGEVYIWLIDTYDFYIDPSAQSVEDAEYCVKAIRRPLDEIKTNPNYTFYDIPVKGEQKQAASEYKQFLLQALRYQAAYTETEEGAILKEAWIKVRINDENVEEITKELRQNDQDTKDLRKGEVIMRVVTYLDFVEDPLRVQLIRRSDYPFELYQADINPMEIYGESWAKHVIPMNRVLNALESSKFEYNYKYAKGRIVIDKNSGVRIITNEHGSIVEKNQGAEVTSLPLQSLPDSYDTQIGNMRGYIEDVGGAHDISFGRIPAGIKSGIGIAELKQADSTNQSDLVDNMEDFLVKVAKKLLKEIAQNYDVPKLIKALGKNGDPEHFAVVGEKSGSKRKNQRQVRIGADNFDIATIGRDNEVTVKIGSWIAYTKEAQQEKLKEYFEAGLIDQQTFLENSEFPNIKGIIERTRRDELLKQFRGSPAAQQQGVSDEEIAEQENIMMVNEGRTDIDPQPTDNHAVHIAIHQDFADNVEISKHMATHERMMKEARTNPQPMQQPMQQPGMQMTPDMMGNIQPQPMQGPPQPQGSMQGAPPNMGGLEIPPMPGAMMGGAPQQSPEEQALLSSIQQLK